MLVCLYQLYFGGISSTRCPAFCAHGLVLFQLRLPSFCVVFHRDPPLSWNHCPHLASQYRRNPFCILAWAFCCSAVASGCLVMMESVGYLEVSRGSRRLVVLQDASFVWVFQLYGLFLDVENWLCPRHAKVDVDQSSREGLVDDKILLGCLFSKLYFYFVLGFGVGSEHDSNPKQNSS